MFYVIEIQFQDKSNAKVYKTFSLLEDAEEFARQKDEEAGTTDLEYTVCDQYGVDFYMDHSWNPEEMI